jgi:hypothetical protein
MIGNTGSNQLAGVVRGIAQRTMESDGLALFRWNDFGEIMPDYSLKLFGYSAPYPVGSYFVVQRLLNAEIMLVSESETENIEVAVPETGLTTNSSGDPAHSHGVDPHGHALHAHPPHTHTVLRQRIFRNLTPGDHVIVAWANQSDPVVIDRYGYFDPTLP